MYSVGLLDLAQLDEKAKQAFQKLTEEKFYCILNGQQPDNISNTTLIAIAVYHGEHPVGLLLASFYKHVKTAEVHSLRVQKDFPFTKIGSQLLARLEEELRLLRCLEVSISYESDNVNFKNLEQVLHACQWSEPEKLQIHCLFEAAKFLPEWIQKGYKPSPSYTAFPWNQLTQTDRKMLERNIEMGVIPAFVSPLKNEEVIEPINSLGLRCDGKVVGWMITHRIDDETICYKALYVMRSIRTSEAIALLCASIWKQKESGVPWAILEVNLQKSPSSWLRFVQRRLVPHATSVSYTYLSQKILLFT